MQCGKIIFDASAKIKNENRYFVSRFTPFFVPNAENSEIQIQDYYKELVENSSRNALIADDVRATVNAGRISLVLSERVSHIEELARRLENAAKNVIVITGRGTAKQKKATLEKLSAVQKNETLIVLATGKYIGEGFDANRFDTLFLAMSISWCSNRRCVKKKSATADFFSIFKKMAHCETCEQGGARLSNIAVVCEKI